MYSYSNRKITGKYVASVFALPPTAPQIIIMWACYKDVLTSDFSGTVFLAHEHMIITGQRPSSSCSATELIAPFTSIINETWLKLYRLVCNPQTVFLNVFLLNQWGAIFNLNLLFNFLNFSFLWTSFSLPPLQPTNVRNSSVLDDTKDRLMGWIKALLCTSYCYSQAIFRKLIDLLTVLAIP